MFSPSGFSVKLTPMGTAVPLHFAINLVPHLNGNRYITDYRGLGEQGKQERIIIPDK
ncbi:MAG: hypothetical protein V7K41_11175 [Nostoc sp.]|uniref:hypothetical protein n=1 Tax=Nostoc sp. TaxID=1180 RepID=UPI002FF4DA39